MASDHMLPQCSLYDDGEFSTTNDLKLDAWKIQINVHYAWQYDPIFDAASHKDC